MKLSQDSRFSHASLKADFLMSELAEIYRRFRPSGDQG
jgi:hypothetical protein